MKKTNKSKLSPFHTLCEICPNRSFFWSVFPRICSGYGDLLRKSLYLVRLGKAQFRKAHIRTIFAQCILHLF